MLSASVEGIFAHSAGDSLRGVTQSGLDHDQSDPLTMLIYAAALLPLVMHVTQCWYADDSTCIGNIKLKVC